MAESKVHTTTAPRLTGSDYAQVLFHNIAETYAINRDLECRYTATPLLTPTSSDWIGVYKVGWTSAARDYVIYNYVNITAGDEGKDIDSSVSFAASKLPRDDGEFYQLCYVAKGGQVRGASTPFQFRTTQQSADEFVEIEDEDNDILVIQSRTAVLEDELERAVESERGMRKTLQLMEREREGLLNRIVDVQKECEEECHEKEEVQKDLKVTQERVESLHIRFADHQKVHETVLIKCADLKKEKDQIEKFVDEKDQDIMKIKEKLSTLTNERDALSGKVKSLSEETDMYKANFSSSESTLSGYKVEIDSLKRRLEQEERGREMAKADVVRLASQLAEQRKKAEIQERLMKQQQVHLQEVSEKLRNCEDKLLAAEQCKHMLNKELDSLQQAYEKMSSDMEKSKSDAYNYKMEVNQLEEQAKQQKQVWASELHEMHCQLHTSTQGNIKLQSDLDCLQEKFAEMERQKPQQEDGALFALQMANDTLKERLGKKSTENVSLQKQLEEVLTKKKRQEKENAENQREVLKLKEHLLVAQETYRDNYIKCQKLKGELKKANRSGRSSVDSRASLEPKTVEVEKENKETATDQGQSADAPSQTSLTVANDSNELLSDPEVLGQLDQLATELDKRRAQKSRYKQLYQEEREKNAALQQHYYAELRKKDEELAGALAEFHDKSDVLLQKNTILQNHIKRNEAKKVELEHELTNLIEGKGKDQAQAAAEYPTGEEASLAPTEPLPLRFGGPNTSPYPPQQMATSTNPFRTNETVFTSTLTPTAPPAAPLPAVAPPPTLTPVLQLPLLQPELTPDAKKVAALAANKKHVKPTKPDDETFTADEIFNPPSAAESDSVDVDEDRFMDAPGDPQRLCPICAFNFPHDTDDATILSHVDGHYGLTCPMCSREFDSHDQDNYKKHVEHHFVD